MRTVGKDIAALNIRIVVIALLISAAVIVASNIERLPVSSHQVIVGSVIGSALAMGCSVNFVTVEKIVEAWLFSPFISMTLSILTYRVMERLLRAVPVFKAERIIRDLLLINGAVIAYNTGANELATALGPLVYSGVLTPLYAVTLGTVALWLGAVMLSWRVIETVGKGITSLDPFSGFCAQFSAGLCVLIFTTLGLPVSTTYCIIGGVIGVGLLKGVRTVRTDLLRRIVTSWVLAPTLTAMLAFSAGHLISESIRWRS